MSQTPHPSASTGERLKARRKELDLSQGALARRIGIDASTVSVTERGHTQIQRGKRSAWEEALQLKPGTISRAYDEGTELEPAPPPDTPSSEGIDPNLGDYYERLIWDMPTSEANRRTLLEIHRAGRAREEGHRHTRRRAG